MEALPTQQSCQGGPHAAPVPIPEGEAEVWYDMASQACNLLYEWWQDKEEVGWSFSWIFVLVPTIGLSARMQEDGLDANG